MDLPTKDKEGNSYLSYSQISLFLKDKNEYLKTYILKQPFISNEYIKFGSKVGEAIEKNDFCLFTKREVETLKKVTRLDLFERKVILNYDDFYIKGYVDTCDNDLTEIIDYKTGGKGKELQYTKDYNQLYYYALAIRQETGKTPLKASVEFIRREGNLYKGEMLKIASEEPLKINIELSEVMLKKVYWETIQIANQISEFYKQNK